MATVPLMTSGYTRQITTKDVTWGWGRGGAGRGGGDARHRRSVDLEGSGGMLLQNLFLYKFD